MKRPLIAAALLLVTDTSVNAQSALTDAERGAIQKAREFCIEALGRDRQNRRIFFGNSDTADAFHAQVNECAMRMMPRYLPPPSR